MESHAKKITCVCVYYPHWHRYPKGDEWFGADRWKQGEWAFVKDARPLYPNHKQPLVPYAGFLDESNPAAYAAYVERVSFVRDACARAGVQLILESGQETAEDLARFLRDVPGLYVNFDPANMILYGKGCPMEALETLVPWIRKIHVKDADATAVPGTWGTERPWGEGQVGGAAFIDALNGLGFTGNLTIEREGGDDRVGDIARAAARLREGR